MQSDRIWMLPLYRYEERDLVRRRQLAYCTRLSTMTFVSLW